MVGILGTCEPKFPAGIEREAGSLTAAGYSLDQSHYSGFRIDAENGDIVSSTIET